MPQQEFTPATAPPQRDTLTLACSHEHQSLNNYRLLSLRFLPYSLALSRLFEVLASESEQRIQALIQMAKYLQATDDLPAVIPSVKPMSNQENFFVIDDAMAVSALAEELSCAHQSALVYQQLGHDNGLSELNTLLAGFAEQKRAECQVLQESRGHLLLNDSMPRQRVA